MPSIARHITQWTKKEIDTAFRASTRRYQSPLFDIRIAPRQHEIGRVLIITPRASGNAPERNVFKRRVKSIFYTEKLYELPFDWIVLTKKSTVCYETIKKAFLDVAEKPSAVS